MRSEDKNTSIYWISRKPGLCCTSLNLKFSLNNSKSRSVRTFSITYCFFSGDSKNELIVKKFWFPKLHCFSWQVQVAKTPRNRVRGLGDLNIRDLLLMSPNIWLKFKIFGQVSHRRSARFVAHFVGQCSFDWFLVSSSFSKMITIWIDLKNCYLQITVPIIRLWVEWLLSFLFIWQEIPFVNSQESDRVLILLSVICRIID